MPVKRLRGAGTSGTSDTARIKKAQERQSTYDKSGRRDEQGPPAPQDRSVAALTGANNAVGVRQIVPTDNAATLPGRMTFPNGTFTYTAPFGNLGTFGSALPVNQPAGPTLGPPPPPGYGYRSFNPGETQADIVRRQQINRLTSPYTGSIAALTGANLVEPVQTGFPGTDRRQRVPVSLDYLGTPPTTPTPTSNYYGGGGRGRGGGGGGGNYGSGTYGGEGGGFYADLMNWRVATG